MKIKTIEISGFVSTLSAVRKPFKGEIKSDTEFHIHSSVKENFLNLESYITFNNKDLELLQKLIKGGDEHAKSVRLINVTADVTAPRYWWQEHDTYEIGVTDGSSESTMHTLMKEIKSFNGILHIDNPQFLQFANQLFNISDKEGIERVTQLKSILTFLQLSINLINQGIEDIRIYKEILPEGFIQTRTINYNYQTLRRIYKQRRTHRIKEWHEFIDWMKTLPYAEELIFIQ